MRNLLISVCLLLALTASVAGAASWTTQMTTTENPVPYIDVLTTATNMGSYWTWTYAMTPKNSATGINGVTLTLGTSVAALVSNVTGPLAGWTMGVNVATGKVSWRTDPNDPNPANYNPLNEGNTFTFGFSHPWGPSAEFKISAQDDYGYSGRVAGPVVPEPTGIMVGLMGLASLAGFAKLRRK